MTSRGLATLAATGICLGLALGVAGTAPAQGATSSPTVPASGTFSFSTGNGILPTWTSEDIVLIGVSPGSVITSSSNLTARVSMPIVAQTGSANAAAGGFRFSNSRTGATVRCSTPTIDTSARLVDCVLPGGKNAALLAIRSIASRTKVNGQSTVTWINRGLILTINGQAMADMLNATLGTTAFSPYVTVGNGDLIVTRDR